MLGYKVMVSFAYIVTIGIHVQLQLGDFWLCQQVESTERRISDHS